MDVTPVVIVRIARGKDSVICRVPETGKVGLISRRYQGPMPEVGEFWRGEIVNENKQFFIFIPQSRLENTS